MKVLVLGSGGREHAIAWRIKQSSNCSELFCLPGNPGTAQIATNLSGSVTDFEGIKSAVLENGIELVVVGPEDPLVNGVRNFFAADDSLKDVLMVGPGKEGAMLEGSKDFAKAFMTRHNVPTAAYRSFTSETIDEADKFLESLEAPYVLKADGLAAGKGVLIPETLEEAKASLREMLGGKFGKAGNTVVIEQFLKGIEVSVFVLTDGKDYLILPEAKDYKRIGVGDKGLNTGGMGAVSPVGFADAEFMKKVEERIIKPTVDGLASDGIDYRGFIFIGLMNCGGDPYVIEYNVRMGDPETEAVMTRIDSDLLAHLVAAAKGELAGEKISISANGALTVVCVSGGYPESYGKGYEIFGSEYLFSSDPADKIKIFHAGTAMKDGKLVTSGGRVLAVTINGNGIEKSREEVYPEIDKIFYTNKYYRSDIGNDLLKYE
ncbi:MAG: phosphoribosylamine--glycine ligase [Bacteroidales bacterium]|nr:phosphoribosylamine--glycine ligase [Bacteroidales bacterium]